MQGRKQKQGITETHLYRKPAKSKILNRKANKRKNPEESIPNHQRRRGQIKYLLEHKKTTPKPQQKRRI